MKKIYIVLVAVLILAAAGAGYWYFFAQTPAKEDINQEPAKLDDLIKVSSPLPGQEISSPFTVTGEARGSWYFEASFPVILKDSNGTVLAQVPAQAEGEWMTTDYVPFKAILNFQKPSGTDTGTLTLEKDNPSGLPENDNSLVIPVVFK